MTWIWFVAFVALTGYSVADGSVYKEMFEDINWDELFSDPKTIGEYMSCIEGSGPCVPHSQILKDTLADVFSTMCGGCSDKQKELFKYSMSKFIPAYPKEWEKILSIYDPKGEYESKLKSFAGV